MAAAKDNFPSDSQTNFASSSRMEWAPTNSLRPNSRNARTHSKKQIRQIGRSISEFGFLNPVLVDDANMILAGHGRFEAARLEGLTHVPIVRFGHLTEAQKRAYAIADNRIAEQAGWDRQRLSIELGELMDLRATEGLDISVTGFEIDEIELLVKNWAKPRSAPEDVAPRPPRHAITRPGDLWLLGGHRLLCGDAQNADNLGRLMEGALAAAAFCAPPSMLAGSPVQPGSSEPPGEMSPEQYRAALSETLGNGARASAEGAIYFVSIDWRGISDLIEVGRKIYGEIANLVVWNKMSAGPGSLYRSQHELIAVFRVGRQRSAINTESRPARSNRSDVWDYPGPKTAGETVLAVPAAARAAKPIALIADALLDCTTKGEIVLDLFAGSGATILAAEKIARTAYAIERETRFVDVTIQRWQRLTMREATLAGDGRDFATIAESRASLEVAPRRLNAVGDPETTADGEFDQDSEVVDREGGGHD